MSRYCPMQNLIRLSKYAVTPLLLLSLSIWISGCSVMPAFGPSSDTIVNAAQNNSSYRDQHHQHMHAALTTPFQLVDVSSATLPTVKQTVNELFSAPFLNQDFLLENQKVIPGDTLVIRIWEGANDGLFASGGQRETVLTLTVSNSGNIDIPYAGNIDVVNLSAHQVREELLRRYKGQAIDPEINVHIQETTSRDVSVLGAVANPGRIRAPAQGIRLHDLIALAGSILHPPWETIIKISRSNHSSTLSMTRVFDQPRNNIVILPGDILYIDHTPRQFAMYGAISKPGNITINKPSPNLSELLAESGGLVDLQADANSVFIFRMNHRKDHAEKKMPMAYRLDFSRPDAFLLAGQFTVLPSDVVYIATAGASEFRKFITTLLSPFLGGTGGIQNLGN